MIKLVIFDLDGTIIDSLQDLADSVNFALKKSSLEQKTLDQIRSFIGNGVNKLIERSIYPKKDKELFLKVRADFKNYYEENCVTNSKAFDGISDLFKALNESKIAVAVLTNKTEVFAKKIIYDVFDDCEIYKVVGQSEIIPPKPDTKGLALLLEDMGVSASECLYVGDSEVDVITAHAMNIECIGVSWGYRSVDELKSANADYIAYSSDEVLKIICEKI